MDNCIVCGFDSFENYCIDWQGNEFDKCQSCGLVVQRSVKNVDYRQVDWKSLVDPDGEKRNLMMEKDKKIKDWYGGVINFLNANKYKKVLDIGCGPGFLLSALNDKIKKRGIELNKECVNYIRNNFPDIDISDKPLEVTNLPQKYFDAVVMYHVIEHLADPFPVLKEASRLLADGGVIIIGTPNMGSYCARRYKGGFRLLGVEHLILYNKRNLTQLLNSLGFEIFRVEYPFFQTSYFNWKNIFRLFLSEKIAPPFWGNIMTLYAKKRVSL